nr:tubulin-folding cofactor A-like [Physcomitrium patens]|eukprot:XP_024382206.1 tubulin-folding cofactor A-like [Physcomitrella patens]
MKNLKIKTGVCKRLMKELQSYQSEADKECIKAKNMRRSHADPFDIKQQVPNPLDITPHCEVSQLVFHVSKTKLFDERARESVKEMLLEKIGFSRIIAARAWFQEHVVAESCLTISNCRKRLETALATLEAAVVDAEAQSTAGESEELSAASELIAQVKPLFIA